MLGDNLQSNRQSSIQSSILNPIANPQSNRQSSVQSPILNPQCNRQSAILNRQLVWVRTSPDVVTSGGRRGRRCWPSVWSSLGRCRRFRTYSSNAGSLASRASDPISADARNTAGSGSSGSRGRNAACRSWARGGRERTSGQTGGSGAPCDDYRANAPFCTSTCSDTISQ